MKLILFVRKSIQLKLTLAFLLVLVPLVVVSLLANRQSEAILRDEIQKRTQGALHAVLENIAVLNTKLEEQSFLITVSTGIVEAWPKLQSDLSLDNLYDIYWMQRQLSSFARVNGSVTEAIIVDGHNGHVISTEEQLDKWPDVERSEWFQRAVNAKSAMTVFAPQENDLKKYPYFKSDRIYFIRTLEVLEPTAEPSVVILTVKRTSYQKLLQSLQPSAATNIRLLYQGAVIAQTSEKSFKAKTDDFQTSAELNGWRMELSQPEQEIFQSSQTIGIFTIIIVCASVLLSILCAWYIYRHIARPMRKLSSGLKRFSNGDLNARLTFTREDELGRVMDSFNHMADSQQRLIEDSYEKEIRLAKSEFQHLQSQINPHFLYNTLNSIYSVATKHGVKEISTMVINLARFFRVSLGKGKSVFTVQETIEHLMYYLNVQMCRLGHFQVDIDLAEETKELPLLKLLLQPIVENAIIHGMEKQTKDGHVHISANLEQDMLQIVVEDSGAGMAAERLRALREELRLITSQTYRSSGESPAVQFFGLKNVLSRVKLYYGDEAELRVVSTQGEGTRVELRLPLGKEDFGEAANRRG